MTPGSEADGEAKRYTLTLPQPAVPVVLVLAGRRLLTNGMPQSFPSVAAAREHLERVLGLRKRDGYVVASVESLSAEEARLAAEASPDAQVTFQGDVWSAILCARESVSKRVCERLVAQLERAAPRRVELRCEPASPGASWAQAVSQRRLPSVRVFVFDVPSEPQSRQGQHALGDLAATLGAMPAVERVFVHGKLSLSACSHAALRELYLVGAPLPPSLLPGLAGCDLPQLERLVLSSDDYSVASKAVVRSVLSLRVPQLREVHVEGTDDLLVTLQLLLADLPPTWRVLGVSGPLDETQEPRLLELLRANVARLAQLEALVLPLANEVSGAGDAAARALLPNLHDSEEYGDPTLPTSYAAW